jgi:hypothetical protein
MKSSVFSPWMKLGRIGPLLTILFGGVIVILGVSGTIKTSSTENIIIALLTLIALDTLSERVGILETIHTKLDKLSQERVGILETIHTKLDKLSQEREKTFLLPDSRVAFEELAKDADEICILAVSGIRLITHHENFLREKISSGCKVRIILTDPDCKAMLLQRRIDSPSVNGISYIRAALRHFVVLSSLRADDMKCEVRLLDLVLPFNVVIVDSDKAVRKMWVSFHIYKIDTIRRPVVHLDPNKDTGWFNMYKEQFEEAWKEAKPLGAFPKLLAQLSRVLPLINEPQPDNQDKFSK